MKNLKIFNHKDFGQVRTIKINNEPWLVAKDIANILGYIDTDQAIRTHIEFEDKLTRKFNGSGQNRDMTIINESGFYALVFGSKLPKAKEFKRWVTSEVLPSIRKTGGYVNGNETDFIIQTITANIMEQLPLIVSETVKTTLNSILNEIQIQKSYGQISTIEPDHNSKTSTSEKFNLLNLKEPSEEIILDIYAEEIEFWEILLREWRRFRSFICPKSEADKMFLNLCNEQYPELNLSIRSLYRKWKSYETEGKKGLIDLRGKHGNHRKKITEVTIRVEC